MSTEDYRLATNAKIKIRSILDSGSNVAGLVTAYDNLVELVHNLNPGILDTKSKLLASSTVSRSQSQESFYSDQTEAILTAKQEQNTDLLDLLRRKEEAMERMRKDYEETVRRITQAHEETIRHICHDREESNRGQ